MERASTPKAENIGANNTETTKTAERTPGLEQLGSNLTQAEDELKGAEETLGQINALLQEQGELLDPSVAEDLNALRDETNEVIKRFGALKAKIENTTKNKEAAEEDLAATASESVSEDVGTPSIENVEKNPEQEEIVAEIEKYSAILDSNAEAFATTDIPKDTVVKWAVLDAPGRTLGSGPETFLVHIDASKKLNDIRQRISDRRGTLNMSPTPPKSMEEVMADPVISQLYKEAEDFRRDLHESGFRFIPINGGVAEDVVFGPNFKGINLVRDTDMGEVTFEQAFAYSEKRIKDYIESVKEESATI